MEPRVVWNVNVPGSGITVPSEIMMCSGLVVGSGIMGAFWDCSAFWVHGALNLRVGLSSKAEHRDSSCQECPPTCGIIKIWVFFWTFTFLCVNLHPERSIC